MPDELAQQMLPLKQVLAAMSIPCYELAGYEADDLLGTISRRANENGDECEFLMVIAAVVKVSCKHGL